MTRQVLHKMLMSAMLVALVFSGVLFAQGNRDEAMNRAIAAQEKHTKVLMAINGVEGTAVGLDDNNQFVVKVYTSRPGVANIPANLEKVPVKIEVTGQFVARLNTTDPWPRPVPIGVSTGHPLITAGTIGCRVKDAAGNLYALSNNHVYANQNDAVLGDEVIQPGTYDGGSLPDDLIGVLSAFEAIDFSGGDNVMDAAIAITDFVGVATPSDGYGTPGKAIISPSLGMSVQKYGRTTGWTHGQIDGINATVNVCYESLGGWICLKQARFVGQIIITPGTFSSGGDSGSLIVTDDENKNPVGLLFAGGETRTIANPIGPVLARFGVTVDDGSSQTPVAPVADFRGSPTSGNAPLTVNFTDLSTGNPTSWSWDFDNNGTIDDTAQNPSYTYNTAGAYTVKLTATNSEGSSTKTKVGYINVTENAPVADFSASPTSGNAPLAVNFTNLSTGNITSLSWDFGDGGTSTAQNPSHTYESAGEYTVALTVSGPEGNDTETKTNYITVTEPASGPLVADFVGSPRSGEAPLTVNFTDLSTGDPLDWLWDFGDGSPWMIFFESTNPSHTYNTPGTYTVMLAISDGIDAAGEEKVGYITVTGPAGDPPVADFSASPITGDFPLLVQFTDLSTENPTSWLWDFGDGVGASAVQNPSYTYNAAGTYTVMLTATNANGSDSQTKTDYITVNTPQPTGTIHVGDLDGQSVSYPKGNWGASVTVTIHDESHSPVVGAYVFGTFTQNGSYSEEVFGETGSDGTCTLTSGQLRDKKGKAVVTFKITDVVGALDYYPVENHDIDGDSDGTTITIIK